MKMFFFPPFVGFVYPFSSKEAGSGQYNITIYEILGTYNQNIF